MVKRIEHVTEDGVEKRWCGKCKNFKPLHIFGYSKSTWDNLRPTCKECIHEYNEEVAESRTEYNKQYWKDTMEKQKEKSKKWREENPEKVKESMRRWLEENKEYKKQKDKEYREAHKEAYKENHRKWCREQYHKMKKENGPDFIQYKLKSNIGRRIREILGQDKSERCIDYVGCSLDELRSHIEKTFVEGMTWDNYGSEWHVDHMIPCAAFDMNDPLQQKACWHHTNLQALCAKENISKKDKFSQEDKTRYLDNYKVIKSSLSS